MSKANNFLCELAMPSLCSLTPSCYWVHSLNETVNGKPFGSTSSLSCVIGWHFLLPRSTCVSLLLPYSGPSGCSVTVELSSIHHNPVIWQKLNEFFQLEPSTTVEHISGIGAKLRDVSWLRPNIPIEISKLPSLSTQSFNTPSTISTMWRELRS